MPQMPDPGMKELAIELLLEEAQSLDKQRWRDWLELYEGAAA